METSSPKETLNSQKNGAEISGRNQAIGNLLARQLSAVAVFLVDVDDAERPLELLSGTLQTIPPHLSNWCFSLAQRCLAQGQVVTESSGNAYTLSGVAVPHCPQQVLLALLENTESEATGMLQLAAMAFRNDSDSNGVGPANQLAALSDLVARMEAVEQVEEASAVLAANLSEYLEAEHVIVGLCGASQRVQLSAASHRDHVDESSEEMLLALALLQEAICRDEICSSINVHEAAARIQPGVLCHQQYADFHQHFTTVGCPLRDQNGQLRGAMLVSFQKNLPAHALPFLEMSRRPIATSLNLLNRAKQNRFYRSLVEVFSQANRHKLRATLVCSAVLVGILCIPMRYTVKAQCRLEPTNKRYIAAPCAGKLLECLVSPGDVVKANQLLAHLDSQETEWELGSVSAEFQRASKERAGHIANHEFGKAKLAQYEMEYFESKVQLLTNRVSQLAVRSPIDGVIVSGDLTKAEGVPLEVGQSLFEISPLDAMVAEVAVMEDDVRFVGESMPVKIYFEAFSFRPYETSVEKVHPRAEIQDSESVFVTDANVDNPTGELRPGMTGTARIQTVRRPIGWILFRRPAAGLVSWLGL